MWLQITYNKLKKNVSFTSFNNIEWFSSRIASWLYLGVIHISTELDFENNTLRNYWTQLK